jgi:hypothetical protein
MRMSRREIQEKMQIRGEGGGEGEEVLREIDAEEIQRFLEDEKEDSKKYSSQLLARSSKNFRKPLEFSFLGFLNFEQLSKQAF